MNRILKSTKVAKVAKKGLFRIVFSRTGIMLLLILIQLGIFIMIPYYLNAYTTYIYGSIPRSESSGTDPHHQFQGESSV